MLPDYLCRVEGGSVPENDKALPFIPDQGCIQSIHLAVRRAIQVLRSTKLPAIEPQGSVAPSLQTGSVTGWFLHGIAMGYRDGGIASPRGQHPGE